MKNTKNKYLFLMLFLMFNFSAGVFAENNKPKVFMDRIVAVVNNQVIADSDLTKEEVGFKKQLDPNSSLAKLKPEELRQKILKQLIDETLQLQLAKQRGVYVSEKALDSAITEIAKRNQLSLSAFRDTVKNHGMNYSDFRERIRKQMIMSRLQQTSIGDSVQVSDQEVDAFLKNKIAIEAVLKEYHLQKLTKAQVRTLLYERKLKAQVDIWLEKLRNTAYIKIMPVI